MTRQLRWRTISVAASVLVCAYLAGATLVPADTRATSALLPDQGLRLGLDLQGGIHWVLGPQLDVAVDQEIAHLRDALKSALEEEKIVPTRIEVEGGRIVVEAPAANLERIRKISADMDVLTAVSGPQGSLTFELSAPWKAEVRERGMQQVLEVLRRRIEDPAKGIPESVVTRQGSERILVQIPGAGDRERAAARALLDTTGFLEFKIVQDFAPSEELLRAKHPDGLPPGTEILFEREKETKRILGASLLPVEAAITGDYLADARATRDNVQRPQVTFRWNDRGATIFRELTEKNIHKQLSIVLDDQVYSAPVIQSAIGREGVITGRFDWQEVVDLAVVLRSGSLPIPITIEEERSVGPALGSDSIRRGTQACILSLVLVCGFALGYYRLSGVYASIALLTNLVMIVGLIAMTGATLTLPGIAGLVLTVGMAIDSNVIIFERIRDELRLGKTPRAAIATGFNKALWAILDANITTLIAAIVLYEYGTGAVKGFAVSLSIGILTTVFTAIVVTRLLFDLWPGQRYVERLSI